MKNKGFTIIELIISIFILSIGAVGIFIAYSAMVILTADTADRLTAIYLAQEGMEIVRNVRDNNWLKIKNNCDAGVSCSFAWNDNLNCENGCEADYTYFGELPMPTWAGKYFFLNDKSFYVYNPTNPSPIKTKFKRKITVILENQYTLRVITQVSWDQKATILNSTGNLAGVCNPANCAQAEELLYNWF